MSKAISKPAEMLAPNLSIEWGDAIDEAHAKALKLEAMLAMTCAGAGESFRDMSDELQDNFLWACQGFAREIKEVLERPLKFDAKASA